MREKLASWMRAAWRALNDLRSTLRARRELHELSDRMLKDIGVNRSEIDSLFR
jgi:uncharacterized protein YjiS (DUF1127 family)